MSRHFLQKPMRSLVNFPRNGHSQSQSQSQSQSEDNDNGNVDENTLLSSITPPQNSPPTKSMRVIEPDSSTLIPGKMRKRKLLGKNIGVVDTLNFDNSNNNSNNKKLKLENQNQTKLAQIKHNGKIIKRASKKNMYIHEEGGNGDNSGDLIPMGRKSAIEGMENSQNEYDGLMELFNVDDVVERSLDLSREVKEAKEKRKARLQEQNQHADFISLNSGSESDVEENVLISTTSNSQSKNHHSNKSREIETFQKNLQRERERKEDKNRNELQYANNGTLSLLNDEDKRIRIRDKFESSNPHINCSIVTSKTDIVKLVKKHSKFIEDILEGKIGSYFYNEAKKVSNSSKLMHVKDSELDSLPKHKYYGYIGAVRGFHIGKAIMEDIKLGKLMKDKSKHSKVMKFWGVDQFAQYVLVPEVIARIVLENGNLADLDEAYDEMENTSEYGTFVANSIPLEDAQASSTKAPVAVEVDFSLSEPEPESDPGSDFDFLK